MYYGELEVLPDDRLRFLFASVCQTIAAVNRPRGRAAKPLKDFLLKFDYGAPPKKSAKQLEMLGRAVAAMYGAK